MQGEQPIAECLPDRAPEGPLARVADRFPLGSGFGRIELSDEPPSGPDTRPFGLRYLEPASGDASDAFDISKVSYCPESQMSMLGDELLIVAATKRDGYCDDKTTYDNQTFTDKVVDKTVPD